MELISTVCPRNCYSSCSLMVQVENNKIKRIFPHDANKATPEGVCLKGLSYIERANSPERIIYPLRKKNNGTFERISWDEAYKTIAEKLQYFKKTYSTQSILFYYASGMSGELNGFSKAFWRLFGGATSTYGNLCWPAGLEATRLMIGENKHNAPWDLENAKLIIIWGKNPVETNVQQIIHIQKAIDQGAKVVLIDPRKSPTAAYAHHFYRIKPGTDGALALAIAHLLVKNNQTDSPFIDKYVHGFEAFCKNIEQNTPEWAAKITGISVNEILSLTKLVASTKPMTIVPGYGMQRYSNGGQTIRCLLALQIITGNIGKKGATWHYANLQSYIFDQTKEPQSYYPEINSEALFRRTISMARLGQDMLAQQNPPIKMMWIERGNPVSQNPETPTVIKAIRQLEFRVVVEQFFTDTALEADIILPAKNMFEQSDFVGGYWNPYMQLRQKLVQPAGEVKPETQIYYELAQYLKIPQEEIDKHLLKPDDKSTENYLKSLLKPFPELNWEALKKGPQIAASHQEIAFEDMKFNTPGGKIELYSSQAKELWNVSPLPDYTHLKEGENNSEFKLYLMSPNTKNRIHSQFGNLNSIKIVDPKPLAYISPELASAKQISEGDKIRIYNNRGSITIEARFDIGMYPNAVLIHNGWQLLNEMSNPNQLSLGRETDMGHGTAFHDNMVAIERVLN